VNLSGDIFAGAAIIFVSRKFGVAEKDFDLDIRGEPNGAAVV